MSASRVVFSVADMMAKASADAGLSDFGSDEFREPLQRLVDATNERMALNPTGVLAFQAEVQRLLVNRLRFADDLKRHPEILEEDVDDPIVIIGLPRTGTTKLQRMLSADPDAQRLDYWRLLNPAPFPTAGTGARDPRIAAGHEAIAIMQQLAPGFLDSHPMSAEQADEETFLQLFTFRSLLTYLLHPAPGFDDWLAAQSQRSTYQYMKRMLQYLQWQERMREGRARGRHWVLKSPVHVGNLDLVVELFPTATIVVTHRDFGEAIPSFCRLIEMGWHLKTDHVDNREIGRMGVDLWSREMRKHLAQRVALGDRVDICDVRYEQVRDDIFGVIGQIYRRAGRALTPQCQQAMRAWDAANPPGQHGPRYRLEDYGLTRGDIDAAFGEFSRRFLS